MNESANESVRDEITNKGQAAHSYTCDLSDRDAIYQTAAKVNIPYTGTSDSNILNHTTQLLH